jgi:hypothetical protein
MMTWTAFIVLNTVIAPINIGSQPGPATVIASADLSGENKPAPIIKLEVDNPSKNYTIGRMTGVEVTTHVHMPNGATSISFSSEALCRKAAETLNKQIGVQSVSCLQTGE